MGISVNYYTIYGVKLAWNKEFNETLEELGYGHNETPFVLKDVMSGKYIILGKVLHEWDEYGDCFSEIDIDSLSDYEEQYRQEFVAKFPEFATLLDHPFKLMTLVHYS